MTMAFLPPAVARGPARATNCRGAKVSGGRTSRTTCAPPTEVKCTVIGVLASDCTPTAATALGDPARPVGTTTALEVDGDSAVAVSTVRYSMACGKARSSRMAKTPEPLLAVNEMENG
jgi:hypothetical protein